MEAAYWHDKWNTGDIKFHQTDYNPLMVRHFPALKLRQGANVFVPLCGKSRDIAWLLDQGYRVVGAELNEGAVQELFEALGLTPQVAQDGNLLRYSTVELTVFVGDIFDLDSRALGAVHAVFDRAALVALPHEMRTRYAAHVIKITELAPQCLLTYSYDQSEMDGPPFSVPSDKVHAIFDPHFKVTQVEVLETPKLKGKVAATEIAWLLTQA